MSEWYCLNCKKTVKTHMDFFKGFALSCDECGQTRLMKLEEVNEKDFDKFVKKFKEETGKVE